MAAPADEHLRELERVLAEAADLGEQRSVAMLREEVGLGHDDLMEALDVLREHGKAQEVAPGEWMGPDVGEAIPGEPEPLRVNVPPAENRDAAADYGQHDQKVAEAMRRFDGSTPAGVEHAGFTIANANVRLTRAIADELDAAALGQIVKAGLKGVDAHEEFVLEVLP